MSVIPQIKVWSFYIGQFFLGGLKILDFLFRPIFLGRLKSPRFLKADFFQPIRLTYYFSPHTSKVIDTQTKLYLILECGDGGDMYDHIMKHEGEGISEVGFYSSIYLGSELIFNRAPLQSTYLDYVWW